MRPLWKSDPDASEWRLRQNLVRRYLLILGVGHLLWLVAIPLFMANKPANLVLFAATGTMAIAVPVWLFRRGAVNPAIETSILSTAVILCVLVPISSSEHPIYLLQLAVALSSVLFLPPYRARLLLASFLFFDSLVFVLQSRGVEFPLVFPFPPAASWMVSVIAFLWVVPAFRFAIALSENAERATRRQLDETRAAAERLEQSEGRFRDLVESSHDLICTHDLEGNFLSVNPAGALHSGYPVDRLLQMNLADLVSPELRHLVPAYLARIRKRGRASGTMRVRRSDGELRYWKYDNSLRVQGLDEPIVRGQARDVTTEVIAMMALVESESRYRSLIENSRDLIQSVRNDGSILFVNKAWKQALGYSAEDVENTNIFDLIHPDSRTRCGDILTRILSGETVHDIEIRLSRKDGSTAILEGDAVPRTIGGSVVATQGFFRDVTERRKTEEALKATQDRLTLAARAGNVGLWEWDLRTDRMYFSAQWKSQLGHSEEEITDSAEEWRSRIEPAERAATLKLVEKTLQPPWPKLLTEYGLRHKDGKYRRILTSATVRLDAGGRPESLIGANLDTTELSKLRKEILQAQKLEIVGKLTGSIAHDFNNLLTVINGYAQLAEDQLGPGDMLGGTIRNIRDAGERGAALTSQLLAFSRNQIVEPVVFDLNHVALDLQKMIESLLGEKIVLNVTPTRVPTPVRADRGQVEQVILNLAINARDAMPDGGTLTIECRNVTSDVTEPRLGVATGGVVLQVTDTGNGVSPSLREKIFEPFFTTKDAGKGTGLGLSTVRRIVSQWGGAVWVDCPPTGGSCFQVCFPRSTGEEALVELDVRPEPSPGGHEYLVVVEDDPAVRKLAVDVLRAAGYAVEAQVDGAAALEKVLAGEAPPDLLVTDLMLPKFSGQELAARARARFPSLHVLYMTGYTDDTVVWRDLESDPLAMIITKPFSPADLTDHVRTLLDLRSARQGTTH